MENNRQITPRVQTQIIYHHVLPRVVASSSANFVRAPDANEEKYRCERPMTLNAWTQTNNEDFDYLAINDNVKTEYQTQVEMNLMQKIRFLEENLQAHTQILSQIHATSLPLHHSGTRPLQHASPPQLHPPSAAATETHIQQQQEPHTTLPNGTGCSNSTTSVINPIQQVQVGSSDSVKYTIIADGTGDASCEPIEVQLAEDDGGINLSSSADSGRLEICLGEENADNNRVTNSQDESPESAQPPNKRSKTAEDPKVLEDHCNYFFNRQGILTPISLCNTKVAPENTYESPVQRPSNTTKAPKAANQNGQTPNIMDSKIDMENVMVSIGPNNTRIPAKVYESISWTSPSIATRKLLMSAFNRQILATHSMTGKPSPAFKDHGKPLKQMLDPVIIQDIIFAVTRKCSVSEKEVRNAITTKCADENKMMKLQENRNRTLREANKENVTK